MAGPVRHPIDIPALEAYLEKTVPEIKAPLEVKQFGFGQSNPTYLLTSIPTRARYVLRKKPPGRLVSKTAHKVEREHRIISALSRGSDVPVPRPYCLCEDPSVIGTAFYVMSFLDGRVITDPAVPGVTPAERSAMFADAVRTLAKLHRVDPAAVGLGGYGGGGGEGKGKGKGGDGTGGAGGGFYDRQVRTWRTICAAQAVTRDADTGQAVGDLPRFDDLMRFFSDQPLRPRDRATLIHGDYKLDNLVFHKTEPRVIGILDWEMSTIGHPLSDLANFLTPYYTARMAPGSTHTVHPGFLPGATPGLPTREAIAALYRSETPDFWRLPVAASSGRGGEGGGEEGKAGEPAGEDELTASLRWAAAFNMFRQAAICQGIAARLAARQASSAEARKYADARGPIAEYAWELVEGAKRAAASSAAVSVPPGSRQRAEKEAKL